MSHGSLNQHAVLPSMSSENVRAPFIVPNVYQANTSGAKVIKKSPKNSSIYISPRQSPTSGNTESPCPVIQPLKSNKPGKSQKSDRRINIACEQCRRLHVKCDGQSICGRCQKTRSECIYVEGEKKIMISLRVLEQLKRENQALKHQLMAAESHKGTLNQKELSSDTLTHFDTISSQYSGTATGGSSDSQSCRISQRSDGDSNKQLSVSDDDGQSNLKSNTKYTQPTIDNLVIPLSEVQPMTQASVGNYMGMSSMTMFGLEIQGFLPDGSNMGVNLDEVTHNKPPLVSHIFQRYGRHYTVHVNLECRPEPFVVEFRLPSYELVLACVDEVQRYLDGCFYFFNMAEFKSNLDNVYNKTVFGQSTSHDVMWYVELLVILSIGENFLTGNSLYHSRYKHELDELLPDENSFAGMRFFRRAHCLIRVMIFDIQASPSVRAVEVLSMCTFYFQMGDCMSGSYVYSGMTVRVSQLLGMHVDADKSVMDECELEHRRRLWWSIYHIDRCIAAKAGLPVCLTDAVYTSELPRDFTRKATSTSDYGLFPQAMYLKAFVDVSRITNSIIADLYYRPPGRPFEILPVLSQIIKKIFEWRDKWPAKLNVDWRNARSELKCSRGAANIFSEYFHCVNLAVRPLLCHFVRKRVLERSFHPAPISLAGQSESVSVLLNASIGASIQTIQCLYELMNKGLFGVNTHLDREYVFSSASTLLLFYAAFGECSLCCPSIERALAILQKCENTGNERALARKKQLLNLASAFEFLHPNHAHTATYFGNICSQSLDFVSQNTNHTVQQALPSVMGGYMHVDNTSFLDFEADLWSEISNEGLWMGNVSKEISSWLNEAVGN